MATPLDRLNFSGDLQPVLERACIAYKAGSLENFSLIPVGYEDCNVVIQTSQGKYVAKIFSKIRTEEDISRYVSVMSHVLAGGVQHPRLYTVAGAYVYRDTEVATVQMVLMEFVEGDSYLQLGRVPTSSERRAVLEQAALIHRIDYHPAYVFDSWAIPNMGSLLERTRQYIDRADLPLVVEAYERFSRIPLDVLPHAFVHGDFTKANIVKADDGKIYVLDFSVANWYPRIQELAVIVANLLHGDSDNNLQERVNIVIQEYSQYSPLTELEKESLYDYSLAGIAMEFMGAHQEKYINGNDTAETDYWLHLGRNGLLAALSVQKDSEFSRN